MRNGIGCLLLNFILAVVSAGQPLQTEEAEPPHLIQTVTEQDIYEGLIWLGALETAVSEEKDCEKAYGNVKGSVVLLHMEDIYGSGVIWDLTPDYVIIASSRHVLEYWEETSGYVRFSQGYFTPGKILYISQEYDVAFLAVDNTEFTYRQLEEMRYVHRSEERRVGKEC